MSVLPRTDAADWQTKSLGEVCSLISRGISPKYLDEGGIRVLNQRCIRDHEIEWSISRRHDDKEKRVASDRFLQFGDGLINSTGTGTLGRVAQVIDTMDEPTTVDSHVTIVRPNPGLFNAKFFGYMLIDIEDQLKNSGEGCGGQTELARSHVAEKFMVRFPSSIKEQERIVTILDEAFEGLAAAAANYGRTLQYIRQLSESSFEGLAPRTEQSTWLQTTVKQIAAPRKGAIRTGPFGSQLLHSEFVDEGIAVLGIDNVVANEFRLGKSRFITLGKYHALERYRVYPGDVLISIMGTCGRCAVVPDDIPVAINTKHLCCITLDRSKCLPGYLHAYFLHHPVAQKFLAERAKGSIMAGLNMGIIQELPVLLPPLKRQAEFLSSLNLLKVDILRLEYAFRAKLNALGALRGSLLNQAFSGESTKQTSRAVVIPFPVSLPNISSTDLHIGILAIAHTAHERAGKDFDFGHVKAEKIAHMIEAYVGVDLGRAPVRDAAGPNDFPHLKKVEHRADKAGYLKFASQPSGAYRVTKKARFDSLVTKTRTALGNRNQDLDKLLNLMTPMTTKQAEIFATVYAAWNNLLMDGEPITDERIVRAAREDWHSDKLNIPRDKFFTAIEWIRTKGLCPEGKGKRVEAKKH